jgi:hypothetical protein
MHKNIEAAEICIDDATGVISEIIKVGVPEHLPVGTVVPSGKEKGRPRRDALNDWWGGRCIPPSRFGIKDALETFGVYSTKLLLKMCYGLSLSDQYWIRPKGAGLTWERVNFFTNGFSSDVGEVLFGRAPKDGDGVDLMSPDSTSDGWLQKKWIVSDGKRVLMKGGSGVFHQEPFNEIIASEIMRRLGVAHVDYRLTFDGDRPFSLCDNFITADTELVPAWRVKETRKKNNNDSDFAHLLRCCGELGIENAESKLGQMLAIDYLIANTDRHYNNFGFVRNAETLAWLGVAPVYDSGTSLWHDTARVGGKVESKPFRSTHEEQIKLVRNLKWFNAVALDRLDEFIINTFSVSADIDEARSRAIAQGVLKRAAQIEARAKERTSFSATMEINQAKVKPPVHGETERQLDTRGGLE